LTDGVRPVTLAGRLVRLEPLSAAHLEPLVAAAADRATYGLTFVPEGPAQMAAYLRDAERARRAGAQLAFATVRAVDGVVVGSTRFTGLEPWAWPPGSRHQRRERPDAVEIGHTWLAAPAQRTGINTEAKLLMLRHAFETWEVHGVWLRTDERNARSRAAIERLGARFDGILRADRAGADDTVRNSAYYSILAEEWPALRARLQGLLDP
jgi:RimJ/RimL family protein N-acetyltransferase